MYKSIHNCNSYISIHCYYAGCVCAWHYTFWFAVVHVCWMWKVATSIEVSNHAITVRGCKIYDVRMSCCYSHKTWMQYFSQCLQSEESQTDYWLVDIISTGSCDQVTMWPEERWCIIAAVTVFFLQKQWLLFFFSFFIEMISICCEMVVTLIIVNVFLSTKLNDDHQVDKVDMFQSKDYGIFAFHVSLLSSFLHILYWGKLHPSSSLHCVEWTARKKENVWRIHWCTKWEKSTTW